jgi:aspartyl-tRNA(Asn)/glutamyl-tRNA(Gln) amidotransferase subunit A
MARSTALPVTELTVTEIARLVAEGEVTPTEFVEAYFARIDEVEPRVQAWCALDRETVRSQAAALTAEAAAGTLRGPLHGVPVGIKDEFHVAGMPTYMATPDGRPQPEDSTAVARLRAAGAIIMGKTHMPIDGRMPPTRNPWNLEHTAGGTSSGSGAAVGARMVPIALGEQTAGSNLRPAAFCGVEGLKPTFGRISKYGCYPFTFSHDHVGIISLTMEDAALVLAALAGPDPRDLASRPEPPPPADLNVATIRPPRIGVVRNVFPERTEPVMREAVDRSAARMRDAGAQVTDVLLPADFELVWHVHRLVGGAERYSFHAGRYAEEPGAPLAIADVAGRLLPASYYLHAQRVRHYLWSTMQDTFLELDALLMAVAPSPAPRGLESTGEASLLVPWSCLGYPAITVNGGLSPEGLPLGLQLVAPPMADYELLRVGAWCEGVLGRLPAPVL